MSGGDWFLREALPEDLPALAAAELALFPDEAWDLDLLREEIFHPWRRYIVAESRADGAILGYAGIMITGDTADLHTIGALREGLGIGRALLAWCEDAARAGLDPAAGPGAERILLEVREDNTRARDLYARAGYEQIARRSGYYRTPAGPVDALVLSKEL